LELSILGFSEKAVASVDLTAKALRRLASAVDKINSTQFVFAGQKLEVLFTKIAKATNSINTTNITNLASAAKSLSSISRLSNLEKMDFEKVGKGFNTLAVAIQPFLNKVKEAEASLTALDGILRRSSGKKIQGLLGGGDTSSKNSLGGLFGLAKAGVALHTARRLGKVMGNLVQAGSDYNETLNLWQVAMRNNLDVADQFVNKMQKAYGISTKTLMNAQAVFKNMIGSLGQISDQTAYALSEALVQMSADYASLYNRTLESAFQNMQSMLAGQVRPIRSAGLDMTETTLYQYYQAIGGTKTMRQLNRTEKQLLSILAVYQQMGSAGALGDMSKTLNQFANQSRMMTEYWAELKTWSGLLLKDLVDQSGMLVYINALLITATEIVKAIAKSRGIGNENYLTGLFETTQATNDEVDELQGKLLDFDKFRSLEGASASPLAIDEKLLQAITGYSSKIDQAQNAAKKLADTWLEFWLTEDGTITKNGETWLGIIKGVGIALGVVIGLGFVAWLVKTGIGIYTYAIKPLGTLIITIGKFAFAIAKTAITAVVDFIQVLYAMNTIALGSSAKAIFTMTAGFIGLAAAITGAFLLITNWSDMSTWQKIIGIVGVATTAILGLAMAFGVFHSAWSMGLATAGIAAGIAMIVASIATVKKDIQQPVQFAAVGASNLDGGTLFVAGEMGKTEAVYTGGNGKTNVANVRQMEQAFYNALSRHSREGNGTIVVQAYLDGEKVYENTTAKAKSQGFVWAKA
jgi:hypothetical protein